MNKSIIAVFSSQYKLLRASRGNFSNFIGFVLKKISTN